MQPNEYEVRVLPTAYQMLGRHVSYVKQINSTAADKLIHQFRVAVRSLKILPNRHPRFEGELMKRIEFRYLIFDKYYLIIYRVQGNRVNIHYVVDGRQDYCSVLEKYINH